MSCSQIYTNCIRWWCPSIFFKYFYRNWFQIDILQNQNWKFAVSDHRINCDSQDSPPKRISIQFRCDLIANQYVTRSRNYIYWMSTKIIIEFPQIAQKKIRAWTRQFNVHALQRKPISVLIYNSRDFFYYKIPETWEKINYQFIDE